MEGYFQQDRKQHVNPDGTTVMVPPDLKVGHNVFIGKNAHIGHGVTFEDGCIIKQGAHIESDVYIQTGTVIDDHAVIGYGVLQTGFTEEALFRGFLLRRVASRFGFATGNSVQAILFGLVHFAGMLAPLGVGWAVGIGVFTGLLGAAAGYVNERFAEGSIVPSWIGHALGNTITGLLAAFSVV